ncbi:MAG: hypothetical protein KGL10_07375, partial [Alphaproteobacteria bacterium]|nr:hypothetical protein [Alphaproteobacteria bacterium]
MKAPLRSRGAGVVALAVLLLVISPSRARAACASPTGNAGTMFFNSSYNVMQFCNGTNWIAMGQVPQTVTRCTAGATTYSTAGTTNTYTVPVGCTSVVVQTYGAGGGG